MVRYITENNKRREMTSEEETAFDNEQNAMRVPNKLKEIRQLRNGLLQDTDWWVLKGDITDEQTAWRKSLRDLPQNNTTDSQYDTLLEKNSDGSLKHAIWKQPTE